MYRSIEWEIEELEVKVIVAKTTDCQSVQVVHLQLENVGVHSSLARAW